mmetsp:Transcript_46223/g.81316  ORF Transcript_46223/g.81316 Transcript_46223/m.81316 type:complete len:260 (+) Transcript_46223:55-834(+)
MAGIADKVKEVFSKYDADGSGDISAKELSTLLTTLNPHLDADKCSKMFESIDVNHDEALQYEEFVDWVTGNTPKYRGAKASILLAASSRSSDDAGSVDYRRRAKLRGKFASLDKNANGTLDFCEIFEFLKKRYPTMSTPDLRFLYDCADKSHDGQVDFFELLDLLTSVPATKANPEEKVEAEHPRAAVIFKEDQKDAMSEAMKKYEEDQKELLGVVNELCAKLEEVRDVDKRHKDFRDAHAKAMREHYAKTGVIMNAHL